VEEKRKKRQRSTRRKGRGSSKRGARGYRKTLFGDKDGSANDARDEEGVAEEGSEVPRDRESAFG